MLKLAVLTSGNGSNLARLIEGVQGGSIDAEIAIVIVSKPEAYALQRAKDAGINAAVLRKADYASIDEFDDAMLARLMQCGAQLLITAGYLTIIGSKTLAAYSGRIINIHPSLLPKYGGMGFYGKHVHTAVIEAGEKVTGATVHYVNEVVDGGEIIMQKSIAVMPDDTPESLSKRVLSECEWNILPRVVQMLCKNNGE